MKLIIDFDSKVIKIEEKVNLGKLVEKLKEMFRDNWKEYDIEVIQVIDYKYPITIEKYPIYPNYPTIMYNNDRLPNTGQYIITC
jgi:hypothetical protein